MVHVVVWLIHDSIGTEADAFGVGFDAFSHTKDTSAATVVDSVANTASDFAAFRVYPLHSFRHAEPEGAAQVSVVYAGTWHSTVVEPPAVTTQTLTHFRFSLRQRFIIWL